MGNYVFIRDSYSNVLEIKESMGTLWLLPHPDRDPVEHRYMTISDAEMSNFMIAAKAYANEASFRAITFIDERLADISKELGRAERNVKEYQSRNALVDIPSQANLTVSSDMHYRDQLTELKLQQRILEMVSSEIHAKDGDEYHVIPSNIGISDSGLSNILQQYNTLVSERNRLVANSSSTNPRVLSLNSSIKDARKSLEMTISNLNNVYSIRERELESTLQRSQRRISDIPRSLPRPARSSERSPF